MVSLTFQVVPIARGDMFVITSSSGDFAPIVGFQSVGLTVAIVVDPRRPWNPIVAGIVGLWPRCIDLCIDHVEDLESSSVADVVVPRFVDSVGPDVRLQSRDCASSTLIDSISCSEYSVYSRYF